MAVLNLFIAEWKKILGNRLLSTFTVWIYPIGLGIFLVLVSLITVFRDDASRSMLTGLPLQWTDMTLAVWGILTEFTVFPILCWPLMAFLVVCFAGEYEWDTWKNIAPRSQRTVIVVSKTLASASAVLVSIILTSQVSAIGWGIAATLEGHDYGPALTGDVLSEFVGKYLLEMALSAGYLLVLAGFATLAALRTRKIVGGLIVGYILAMLDSVSMLLFLLFASLFGKPEIGGLVRFTPSYSVRNIRFVALGGAFPVPGAEGVIIEPELGFSVIVLVGWIVGLLALNLYLFQKQDLTS